jgi:hypothetical protein
MAPNSDGGRLGRIFLYLFAAYLLYQLQHCSSSQQQPVYIQQPQVPQVPQPTLGSINQSLPAELRMPGHQGGVTCTQGFDDISGQLVTKCLPN